MIGVTAAASAGVYFARGDIDPFIAAPGGDGRDARRDGRLPRARENRQPAAANRVRRDFGDRFRTDDLEGDAMKRDH